MRDRRDPGRQRPWTVQVLVGFIIGSLVWMLATVDVVDLRRYIVLAVATLIAAGLWRGDTWAYTVSFMLLTLGVGLMLFVGGVRLFLLEETVTPEHVGLLVGAVTGVALLLQPETRRFTRVEKGRVAA